MSADLKYKLGDSVPAGSFKYIAWTPEADDLAVCGIPQKLDIEKEWKGKKVVLVAVPGAFTPTCHANHLPPYVEKIQEFKNKGVDVIAFIAANDPFVLSAWNKATKGAEDKILFLSDGNAEWSKKLGLHLDLTSKGFGVRTNRYAAIIDDLKFSYLEVEQPGELKVSSAETVLSKL